MAHAAKRAQFAIIFLTIFIDLVGFGIVIPILPLYAKHFGASELTNGWLVGIYSAMAFLFAPILGRLSDRVGRRPVLLVSLLGTAAGFLLMGVAGTLTWLFVARIIDGISGGNISTAQAYIADITAPEERSRAMGLIGAAFGLGFVLGPAIGGLMSQISIAAPFFFAASLALLNALLVFFLLPESLAREHRTQPQDRASTLEVFRHGSHLPAIMGGYFLTIAGFSILTTNFALFTNYRFGYGQRDNGYLFAFIGLIGAFVQGGLLRPLLKRASERTLALCGAVLLSAGLAAMPFSSGLAPLLIFATTTSIGHSLIMPTLNGLASRGAERHWQGRVLGLMQSAGSLGRWIGPFLAGYLLAIDAGKPAAHYGRTPFWVAAAILLFSLVLLLRIPSPQTAGAEERAEPAAAG